MKKLMYPWSDNWWIEDNKAWFCGGQIGALFCVDMKTQQCEFVARIPECKFENFRLYSYCIKYMNKVFCLPSIEDNIWIYDIEENTWEKVEMGNSNQVETCLFSQERIRDRVYLYSITGEELYEINLEKKETKRVWNFLQCWDFPKYEQVNEGLYCIKNKEVTYFNISGDSKDPIVYKVSDIQTDFTTICYDGTNFWLSGYCKEIYVWNPEKGLIKRITEFPPKFGFYSFKKGEIPKLDCESFMNKECSLFKESIALGKYIWFIPYRSNCLIYVDKETYEVFLLELENEYETKDSIENHFMDHKFLLVYIYENRYVGLYSLKNRCYFEIDTMKLCIRYPDYRLSEESTRAVVKNLVDNKTMFRESKKWDREKYSLLLEAGYKNEASDHLYIGKMIYNSINAAD